MDHLVKMIWTRSRADWHKDQAQLAAYGIQSPEVLHLPCLEIRPLLMTLSKEQAASDALIITSANCAEIALASAALKPLWQNRCQIYTLSESVEAMIHRVHPHVGVTRFEGVRTGLELAARVKPVLKRDAKVLSLGAQDMAFDFASFFQTEGFTASHLICYETVSHLTTSCGEPIPATQLQFLAEKFQGVVCFASPSAVIGFTTTLASHPVQKWQDQMQVVAIGPTTAESARPIFKQIKISEKNDLGHLIRCASRARD